MNYVIDRFLETVDADPERLAVATERRRATRGQVHHGYRGVARILAERPTGVPVVAIVEDAFDVAVAALAAASVARPLSLIGAGASREAVELHAGALEATIIDVTDHDLQPPIRRLGRMRHGPSTSEGTETRDLALDDALLLGTTSGSTGRPKPVVRTVRSLVSEVPTTAVADSDEPAGNLKRNAHISGDVTFRTFFVGAGTARALLRALLDGVPMVCPDPRAVPASRLLTMVDAEQVTVARMVPSVLRRALASAPSDLRLMTLQRVMSGGEPLLWTDVATLRRHMVPGSWVVHTYGSTETGSIARYAISFDDPIGSGVVPVGTAAPGRTVTVVDEAGLPVPTGETGRVVVEGRLGAHDERFELIEGGWQRFVTSDLGTIDSSGVLRLVGRSDDVVKIGAVRVDLATIEAVLRGAPDVAEVAVIAHGDAVRTTIVAHVVMASHHSASSEITTTGLRNFLAPRLVSAAVPHRFVLHPEPLPLLVSGKVDRRRLRELAEG